MHVIPYCPKFSQYNFTNFLTEVRFAKIYLSNLNLKSKVGRYKMAAVYIGSHGTKGDGHLFMIIIDNNPKLKLAKKSKSIDNYFMPFHSEIKARCPTISQDDV